MWIHESKTLDLSNIFLSSLVSDWNLKYQFEYLVAMRAEERKLHKKKKKYQHFDQTTE